MDDIQAFKAHFDIIQAASDLGCLPPKKGALYQGGICPTGHESKGARCFTLYPKTQSGYCFHCGAFFDVIKITMTAKGLEFIEACNWLSDTYHVPRLATKKMDPQERSHYEANIKQQRIIYSILTESARFYHEKLTDHQEAKNHLINHYGLNEDTISSYCLGYSTGEGLLEHLLRKGYRQEDIICTGLLIKVGGRYPEFFNNRLIFPYWKGGNVVYFIGRKTDRTPDKDWEQGKYKKLPVHSEERPYISEFISNQYYYGEDSIRGSDKCFVAEGITDCLALLQNNEPCISPVTVRFRDTDFPRLENLIKNIRTIYLIPDNEETQAGFSGAMDTAASLEKLGKTVFIITIPRPEGQEKIDLNEYLLTRGKEDFNELVKQAKPLWEIKIDQLRVPDNRVEAIGSVRFFILTKLISYDYLTVKTIMKNHLKKKFSLDADEIRELLRLWSEEKKEREARKEHEARKKYGTANTSDALNKVREADGGNWQEGGDNHKHGPRLCVPIFESDNRIFRVKIKERLGEKVPEETPITSFAIEPVESITIPAEGEILRVKLITTTQKVFETLFPPNSWGTTQNFIKSLPNKETIFTGDNKDVQYIRGYLSNFQMVHKTGIKTSGFHDGQFITEEGALSIHGISEGIVYFNEIPTNCKLISTEPATREELAEIAKYITEFNIPTVSLPILGWVIACFFKPRASKILEENGVGNGFLLLNLQGEAGAGKTDTVKSVVMRIWAIHNEPKSIGELTKFTMMKLVDGSNAIPVVMEENKSCMQTEYYQNLISNLIRSTYNCLEGERGRADQSTQVYRYQAPVVIVGETGFTEPALLDRFVTVFLSKKESGPYLQDFKRLRQQPLEKLGRTILEKALTMDKKSIKDILDGELKAIDSDLSDRPRNNAAVCRFGLKILGDVLGMQVNLAKIDEAVKNGLLEGNSPYRKSAVDKILEAMCLMSEFQKKSESDKTEKEYLYQDHLIAGVEYEVHYEAAVTTLRLWPSAAYAKVSKWARAHKFEGDLLPKPTFIKQLQKEPYFVSLGPMRIGENTRWGVEIDIDKVKKKGLELTNLWEFDVDSPF